MDLFWYHLNEHHNKMLMHVCSWSVYVSYQLQEANGKHFDFFLRETGSVNVINTLKSVVNMNGYSIQIIIMYYQTTKAEVFGFIY